MTKIQLKTEPIKCVICNTLYDPDEHDVCPICAGDPSFIVLDEDEEIEEEDYKLCNKCQCLAAETCPGSASYITECIAFISNKSKG